MTTTSPHVHALARIKLDELRRQHDTLSARYDVLEAEARDADRALLDRVEALTQALGGLRFAGTALHPAVGALRESLGVVLTEGAAGRADEALLRRALDRLLRELDQGRTRVGFSRMFGELIEERLRQPVASPTEIDPALLDLVRDEGPSAERAAARFEALWRRHEPAARPLRRRFGERDEALLGLPTNQAIVRDALGHIAAGPLWSPSCRAAAVEALHNDAVVSEHLDVLKILLERLDAWRWPERGVPLHHEWEHGRCRLSLAEPLTDAVLLEYVGGQWCSIVRAFRSGHLRLTDDEMEHWLFPLPESPTPEVRADVDAVRSYARAAGSYVLDLALAHESERLAGTSLLFKSPYGGLAQPSDLAEPRNQDRLLAAVVAQLGARRALDPSRPQCVLQLDFARFFASIPHAVVLALLKELGLTPRWMDFIARFLAVPGVHEGAALPWRRGLPAGRSLSWALAELLLIPLEVELLERTGLRMLRVMDDIVLVTDDLERAREAWRVVRAFSHDCGLTVHPEKSGFVRVGEAEPVDVGDLPSNAPSWGLLRLRPDGRWTVDDARIAALRAWTRGRLDDAPSTLDRVERFNVEALYLVRSLGLTVDLGPLHARAVAPVVAAFQQTLFGDATGIHEHLGERFRGGALPTPLLHWPVTAGGLGLVQPMIAVHALALAQRKRPERVYPAPPSHDELARVAARLERVWVQRDRADPPWERAELHKRLLAALAPVYGQVWRELSAAETFALAPESPTESPELAALREDFVRRGSELGGRVQVGLSAYWRWALTTYGPALLDVVGTFRFLLTELVPLPLLLGPSRGARAPARDDRPEPVPPPDESIPF